jgi:hypothetical protein
MRRLESETRSDGFDPPRERALARFPYQAANEFAAGDSQPGLDNQLGSSFA